MSEKDNEKSETENVRIHEVESRSEEGINASGHIQELDRNFNLISIAGLGVNSGNTWAALGGILVVTIANGGPVGVIYEFIAASVFYWLIAASIAELASAVPSAGGVYHWASITAGRYGRPVGFFAGWLNFFAWIMSLAAVCQIDAFIVTSMYTLYHPTLVIQRWHVFVAYQGFNLLFYAMVLWYNRWLPALEQLGGFLTIAGCFITIVVAAALGGSGGDGRATNAFVWQDWQNLTGWKSDGFVFLLGMLNGAFAVGPTDIITHLAEEVPRPSTNLPKAIFFQYVIGFVTGLTWLIAIFYGISDFDAVSKDAASFLFPLTAIYIQCTSNKAGAFGLLLILLLPMITAVIGSFLTSSRVLWTMARDDAAPFAKWLSKVHQRNRNPSNSITVCAILTALLGCIYLGSPAAFTAFVGSYVILSSVSYVLVILPHLLSRRKNVSPGWFWMGGWKGFVVNGISSVYIIVFGVIYLFPQVQPVTPLTMNWTVVLVAGTTFGIGAFWAWKQKDYKGPPGIMGERVEVTAKDAL